MHKQRTDVQGNILFCNRERANQLYTIPCKEKLTDCHSDPVNLFAQGESSVYMLFVYNIKAFAVHMHLQLFA